MEMGERVQAAADACYMACHAQSMAGGGWDLTHCAVREM